MMDIKQYLFNYIIVHIKGLTRVSRYSARCTNIGENNFLLKTLIVLLYLIYISLDCPPFKTKINFI